MLASAHSTVSIALTILNLKGISEVLLFYCSNTQVIVVNMMKHIHQHPL